MPFDAPLSGHRTTLRLAQQRLAEARLAVEAAHGPLRRLDERRQEQRAVRAELAGHRRSRAEAVAAWIAAGEIGDRPAGEPCMVGLEQRVVELSRDAGAIHTIYAAAQAKAAAASGSVVAAGAELAVGVANAAVEACDGVVAEYRDRLRLALLAQAKVESVIAALQAEGNTSATAAAIMLRERLVEARRTVEVPRDGESGRALLARLSTDPEAEL
jgi:hypothetical protein